jgi:parvulin-like peptidyl-prolyl isomerase
MTAIGRERRTCTVSRNGTPALPGALLAAIAAVAPAPAQEPTPLVAGSPLIATWKGGSLTRADYESWRTFHDLADGPDAIRELVFVESLAAIGRARGVEQELRTRLELEAARQQVLLPVLHAHVTAEVTVSDDEVAALHHQHPDAFHRPRKLRLRNIYKRLDDAEARAAATRASMEELHRRLLDGADFAELAPQESESQSRFRGGHLGFLAPDELPPAVAAAVRDLSPGDISAPVEHGDGLSIFLCEEVREARVPTRDEALEKLRTNLLRQRRRERWTEYREGLLAEAEPLGRAGKETAALEGDGDLLDQAAVSELVRLRLPETDPAGLDEEQLAGLVRDWRLDVLGVRAAVEHQLDRAPEIVAALGFRRLDVLARRELVRRVDERLREPSEEELRRRFDADPSRYREEAGYELAVIQLTDEDDGQAQRDVQRARDVARRIESGELSFTDAARRYSQHPSAASGGAIGFVRRRQAAAWGPTASNALRRMTPGETSGLLHLDSGLWIFELRERRASRPMTFDAARERIRDELRREQIRELEQSLRDEHLAELDLTIVATPEC